MQHRRKIIVSIATSADGYIARLDGSVEWLDRPMPRGNYGMDKFFRSIDTILWGRKTYEMALGKAGAGGFGPKVKNYVFSHQPQPPAKDWEFVKDDIQTFCQRLRAEPGKDVWIMGGGGLIGSLLDAGEIDEFILSVIPVLIGEGIPLIQPRHRLAPLNLLSCRQYPDGVVGLHYRATSPGFGS